MGIAKVQKHNKPERSKLHNFKLNNKDQTYKAFLFSSPSPNKSRQEDRTSQLFLLLFSLLTAFLMRIDDRTDAIEPSLGCKVTAVPGHIALLWSWIRL